MKFFIAFFAVLILGCGIEDEVTPVPEYTFEITQDNGTYLGIRPLVIYPGCFQLRYYHNGIDRGSIVYSCQDCRRYHACSCYSPGDRVGVRLITDDGLVNEYRELILK